MCIYILGLSIVAVFAILLVHFGTVLKVLDFCFSFYWHDDFTATIIHRADKSHETPGLTLFLSMLRTLVVCFLYCIMLLFSVYPHYIYNNVGYLYILNTQNTYDVQQSDMLMY